MPTGSHAETPPTQPLPVHPTPAAHPPTKACLLPLTSKVFPVTSNSGGTKAPSGSSGEGREDAEIRCLPGLRGGGAGGREAVPGAWGQTPALSSQELDSASCPFPVLVPGGMKPPPSWQVWEGGSEEEEWGAVFPEEGAEASEPSWGWGAAPHPHLLRIPPGHHPRNPGCGPAPRPHR